MSAVNIDIDIDVQHDEWLKALPDYEELTNKISNAVFAAVGFDKAANHIEFSVILTDDKEIKKLNKEYRAVDKPTNVLSFPAEEISPDHFDQVPTYEGYIVIGDILFAYKTIKEEADSLEIRFIDHFTHLLVHGILHLLGYDHIIDSEAEKMESIEIKILAQFNISSPYDNV